LLNYQQLSHNIALIATASQQKLTPEEIKLKAQELGLNLDQPHLKQFLHSRSSQNLL
jgi:hypothetical protein